MLFPVDSITQLLDTLRFELVVNHEVFLSCYPEDDSEILQCFWTCFCMNAHLPHTKTSCHHLLSTLSFRSRPAPNSNTVLNWITMIHGFYVIIVILYLNILYSCLVWYYRVSHSVLDFNTKWVLKLKYAAAMNDWWMPTYLILEPLATSYRVHSDPVLFVVIKTSRTAWYKYILITEVIFLLMMHLLHMLSIPQRGSTTLKRVVVPRKVDIGISAVRRLQFLSFDLLYVKYTWPYSTYLTTSVKIVFVHVHRSFQ